MVVEPANKFARFLETNIIQVSRLLYLFFVIGAAHNFIQHLNTKKIN